MSKQAKRMSLQTNTTSGRRTKASTNSFDMGSMRASAREASELLKALSHEARLMILCMLTEGEKSVGEIEQMVKLRQPAVSQQLARLRADDLVETRRDGKNVYYSLARPEVQEVIAALHRSFCKPSRKSR